MTQTTPSTPLISIPTPRPVRAPRPRIPGAWRYQSGGRSRVMLVLSILTSVGLHLVVLFAFNRPPAKIKPVAAEEEMVIALVMPDLTELDEPEPLPSDSEEPPVDLGLTVPTLADVPSMVDLSDAFVQQIDYSSLTPQQDLSAAKAITIPTNINRGGRIGGDGNMFNIADLDRRPEPVVRVAPQVPLGLRTAGYKGEVTLTFIVDANGVVVNPMVMKSSDRRLEDAALIAISKWKFRAGIKGGRKVATRNVQQQVLFNVSERD